MTLKIEINAHLDQGPLDEQVEQALQAIGFVRHVRTMEKGPSMMELVQRHAVEAAQAAEATEPAETANEPKRERGKPAPGKQRRTKEEIAEDEAAEKAEASGTQAISTGGERVGPEDASDSEDVAMQDKADEQAEVEASRNPEKPLTVDDVKAAVGLYVNKHGMPATNEDGPAIFVKALGQPPEGNPFWKMSILPDDQDKLKACVDEWTKAAASDKRYGA